jgi:hypothetical protein
MEHGLVRKAARAAALAEEWPEYRVVIPAEEPVSRQVKHLRLQWEVKYGRAAADKPPSITVACLQIREEKEETLIRWIGKIANNQLPFQVTLNNFGGIPPQVVYIRVQEDQPFRSLGKQLETMADFIGGEGLTQARIFEKPFIQLGKLPETAGGLDWFQFSHQLFHAAFMARQLVLLRRQQDSWKAVSYFPFKQAL